MGQGERGSSGACDVLRTLDQQLERGIQFRLFEVWLSARITGCFGRRQASSGIAGSDRSGEAVPRIERILARR